MVNGWKNWLMVAIVAAMLGYGLYGCQTDQNGKVSLTPQAAAVADKTATVIETTVPPATAAGSAAFPALAPIISLAGGLLVGLAGMWRKLKPQVTQAKTKAEQTYNVTAALVTAIEQFKKSNPAEWDKLAEHLDGKMGNLSPELLNIIRAIRGLPPKSTGA